MLHDISKTYFTYFSGGDGAGLGLEAAGYRHMGGVEYDAQIAAVAAANGHPLTVADVRSVDPALLLDRAPDWFHASPVCKEFSAAKANGKESTLDIETAQATAHFIRHWLPPVVSIENVWQYRESASFKLLCDCLTECGYSYEYWHLNSADYGVPQTRRRLILVARRGLWYIQRPEPTHTEGGDMFTPAWIGWYEAVSGMLTPRSLRPYQVRYLAPIKKQIQKPVLVDTQNCGRELTVREPHEPSPTLTSSQHRRPTSALVWTDGQRDGEITPEIAKILQSLPASYQLPSDTRLAGIVVGNMVPPLLMQRVAESIRG